MGGLLFGASLKEDHFPVDVILTDYEVYLITRETEYFLKITYPFLTSRYFWKDYWPRSVKLKISWIVLFQAKFNNQPNSKCSRFFAERVVSFKWHTTLKKDHKLNRCSEKTFGSFDTFNIYQALKSVASLPERKKNSQLI